MIGPDGSDEMQFNLGQRGRSLMDCEVSALQTATRLHQRVEGELADRGITAETLPDDLEARPPPIDDALAASPIYPSPARLRQRGSTTTISSPAHPIDKTQSQPTP